MQDTLTLEQSFDFNNMKKASQHLRKQQALDLLDQSQTQLLIKTNLINNFLNQQTFNFSNNALALTVEQQLQKQIMLATYNEKSRDEVVEKLLETVVLLMNKDSAIKECMKNEFNVR